MKFIAINFKLIVKQIFLPIICLLPILSCSNRYEKNLQQMTSNVKQMLLDEAFKNNKKLNILEIKVLRYDTISENYVDSIRLKAIGFQFNYYNNVIQSTLKLAKLKQQQAYLYNELNIKDIAKMNLDESNADVEKAKVLSDTLKLFALQDSLIRVKIMNRVNPKIFFKAKAFIKATESDDKESKNTLDTLYYIFDKDLIIKKDIFQIKI